MFYATKLTPPLLPSIKKEKCEYKESTLWLFVTINIYTIWMDDEKLKGRQIKEGESILQKKSVFLKGNLGFGLNSSSNEED